ncbi:MAG: VOC family protein [Flavisolibacter sp.]
MKVIPVLRCRDLAASLRFYSNTLDFQIRHDHTDNTLVLIKNGMAELLLSTEEGAFRTRVMIRVENVDRAFENVVSKGHRTSEASSPAHRQPIDQDWGMRVFYVDDPDGNSIGFCQPVL